MYGIPISNTPSLIEIADACNDYRTSGISLKNYSYVKKTDGSVSGNGTSINPIKFSQFAEKTIKYDSTLQELFSTIKAVFYGWIYFNSSANTTWLSVCGGASGGPVVVGNTIGTISRSGPTPPSWTYEYGTQTAVSDDGNIIALEGRLQYGNYGGYYWGGQNFFQVLRWNGSSYIPIPHDVYGFEFINWTSTTDGSNKHLLGKIVQNGNTYMIPYSLTTNSGYWNIYSNNTYDYNNVLNTSGAAYDRQLSVDLQRYFVRLHAADGGTARVYRKSNGSWASEKDFGNVPPNSIPLFTSTNPDISVVSIPNNVIWNRSGTSWTQNNMSDMGENQYSSFAISNEGTRVYGSVTYDDERIGQISKKYTSNPKWYTISKGGDAGFGYNGMYPRIFMSGNSSYFTRGPYGSTTEGGTDVRIRVYKYTVTVSST